MENANQKNAQIVFDMISETLKARNLKFVKPEGQKSVYLQVAADEMTIGLLIDVDEDRQLIRMISMLPFEFPKEKLIEGAIATSMTDFNMFDGSFDFNYEKGAVTFRITTSFLNSVISPAVCLSMIGRAFTTIEDYGIKLMKLANGQMTLDQYVDLFDEE